MYFDTDKIARVLLLMASVMTCGLFYIGTKMIFKGTKEMINRPLMLRFTKIIELVMYALGIVICHLIANDVYATIGMTVVAVTMIFYSSYIESCVKDNSGQYLKEFVGE
jgi:type III secretory pathway component EscU